MPDVGGRDLFLSLSVPPCEHPLSSGLLLSTARGPHGHPVKDAEDHSFAGHSGSCL